jgi:CheY-like chemotaxis protein
MGMRGAILVVDDDAALAKSLVDRLSASGWRATAAYDRAEALIQATAIQASLILCDISMPVWGSGIDAYRDFRANPALKNVPVIFLTGLTLEQAKAQVPFDDPLVRLMKKPVNWVMLEQAIEELLGERKPLDGDKPDA